MSQSDWRVKVSFKLHRFLFALVVLAILGTGTSEAQEVFVDFDSEWRYFKGTEAPSAPDATTWRNSDFDDAAWEVGQAGIGYGDGDDTTILDDMEDSYITVYARTTFEVDDPAAINSLLLSIYFDDSFVCYINGQEAHRVNAGAAGTELAFDTVATAGHEADVLEFYTLDDDLPLLQAGTNTIAFEIHNLTIGSSDLSFNPRLTGDDPRLNCVDAVTCTNSLDEITLTWAGGIEFDSITVMKNGAAMPGSPFSGDASQIIDTEPGDFINTYELTFTLNGVDCDVVTCSTTPDYNIISQGEIWKYFKGTQEPSDPVEAWRALNFADETWEEGPTGIGYADNDDATVLDDMEDNYVSVYMRKVFSVPDPGALTNLVLSFDYDDGFVAYINGEEVARSATMGAAGTPVAFDDTASANHEANGAEIFDISAVIPSLNAGDNILAIQVHNTSIGSSDLTAIPELTTNSCDFTIACAYDDVEGSVTIDIGAVGAESIAITRNGVPLAGSPFSGDTMQVVDDNPPAQDVTYEVIPTIAGAECPPQSCTVNCTSRFPDALTCVLSLVDGSTRATLAWGEFGAGATSIEISREGTLLDTLEPGVNTYIDPDVESLEPEEDTDYDVTFIFEDGSSCTIECNASLCPENLVCTTNDQDQAVLTWENMVKNWESVTILADGVPVAEGLPGNTTTYTDTETEILPGAPVDYMIVPVAPLGEEVTGCELSCSVTVQVEEVAAYAAPAGGWDYQTDFAAGEDQYNAEIGVTGNLDGSWIRIDSWDGSAPEEIGAAPDGAAPGGVEILNIAGGSECGSSASVLRILDPGQPSNPAGTLLAEYPEAFTEPSNDRIFLALDLETPDANLLRNGVTIAARWRVTPAVDSPSFIGANAGGDGSPLIDGLGQIGLYYIDQTAEPLNGASASVALSLNSNGNFQASTAPTSTLGANNIDEFRSVWITIEDPEGDDTYNVNLYMNGQTEPFAQLFTGTDLALQAPDIGITPDPDLGIDPIVGNFLGIGAPHGTNDADIQIDYVAYKAGIHVPTTEECEIDPNDPIFKRGDVDVNGALEITDPIQNLTFQFIGGIVPPCMEALDFDNNGAVEITDPILSLGHQFLGNAPPAPPGKDTCGPDPEGDDDGVTCESYPVADHCP